MFSSVLLPLKDSGGHPPSNGHVNAGQSKETNDGPLSKDEDKRPSSFPSESNTGPPLMPPHDGQSIWRLGHGSMQRSLPIGYRSVTLPVQTSTLPDNMTHVSSVISKFCCPARKPVRVNVSPTLGSRVVIKAWQKTLLGGSSDAAERPRMQKSVLGTGVILRTFQICTPWVVSPVTRVPIVPFRIPSMYGPMTWSAQSAMPGPTNTPEPSMEWEVRVRKWIESNSSFEAFPVSQRHGLFRTAIHRS